LVRSLRVAGRFGRTLCTSEWLDHKGDFLSMSEFGLDNS
jgi:hypothetical protein